MGRIGLRNRGTCERSGNVQSQHGSTVRRHLMGAWMRWKELQVQPNRKTETGRTHDDHCIVVASWWHIIVQLAAYTILIPIILPWVIYIRILYYQHLSILYHLPPVKPEKSLTAAVSWKTSKIIIPIHKIQVTLRIQLQKALKILFEAQGKNSMSRVLITTFSPSFDRCSSIKIKSCIQWKHSVNSSKWTGPQRLRSWNRRLGKLKHTNTEHN